MKWHKRLLYYLVCKLLKRVLTLLESSCRVQHIQGEEQLNKIVESGEPTIFCFWHNNIFYCAPFLQKTILQKGVHLSVLISRSQDGELIARIVNMWGATSIRGSSSNHGREAFRVLYKNLKKKYNGVIITPDGPRGPKYKFQVGAITLAQLTQATILPIHFEAEKKWVLNSWDSFIIPKPFSKVVVQVGVPYRVPKILDEAKIEKIRQKIEEIMIKQINEGKETLKKYCSTLPQ